MNNSESNEWIYSANFDEAFANLIAGEEFFNFVSYNLTSDKHWSDFATRFPGTQATPFRRELRRWIKKAAPHRIKPRAKEDRQKPRQIEDPNFHGTIKNLEIYCKLFKKTPNQVLGIVAPEIHGTNLRFLTPEDIETICYVIKRHGDRFINVKWPVLLPVEFHTEKFTMMYLKIYKSRPDNKMFTMSYLACDLNRALLVGDDDDIIFEATATWPRSSTSQDFEADLDDDYKTAVENIFDLERSSRGVPRFAFDGTPSFSTILAECLSFDGEKLSGVFYDIFSADTIYDESEDEYYDDLDRKKQEAEKRKLQK